MWKVTILAAAVLTALYGFGDGAFAQRIDRERSRDGDWERLGCVDVGHGSERETIKVGRQDGTFAAIRLSAKVNDVQINEVTVVYGNGKPDRLRVPDVLREGDKTRPLDLEGRIRFIREIQLSLRKDFTGRGKGPAKVCVAGFDPGPAPKPRARANWEELGCVAVGLQKDFDVIKVGRREGRFGAVRLRVKGGKIEIERLRVFYGNGELDMLVVNADLRKNTQSGSIDLKGAHDRVIERIELVSKRDSKDAIKSVLKNVLKGSGPKVSRAMICIDGLDTRSDRWQRR